MSKTLLVRYIKLVLEGEQARVPNQLLDISDKDKEEKDADEVEDVQEFCAVGSGGAGGAGAAPQIMGHMGANAFGGAKPPKKRRKK